MQKPRRTIEEQTIKSRFLNKDITTIIYLPPNYSPLYTYPLVIAQDGKDYFNLGQIAKYTDQLIEEQRIEDVVICGIPYESVKGRWHWYHPDGRDHANYVKFLVYELLPFLNAHYALEDLAGARTLIGDSLGGSVSLETALRFPHTFGQVVMQSPFVDDALIQKVRQFANDTPLSIYHSIGTNETAIKTTWGKKADFLTPNRKLHEALEQKQCGFYHYSENEGNHTWRHWQKELPTALESMLGKE